MLPIVARGQAMDGTLAKFAGIPFPALGGLKNSCRDDFAVHLRLTDILEHLTGQGGRRRKYGRRVERFSEKNPRKLRGFLFQVGVLLNRVWCLISLRPGGAG
jgi:hypothetical protein